MNRGIILESDPVLRDILRAVLREQDFSEIGVEDPASVRQADKSTIYFFSAAPGIEPPPGFEIEKIDRFFRPLRLGKLLDRLHIRCRSSGASVSPATLDIGPYEVDCINNSAQNRITGQKVRLTEKERRILEFLAAHKGSVVNRQALLLEIWGYDKELETHTLETHIYRLRQKIEADPAAPDIILTEGQGYRLA